MLSFSKIWVFSLFVLALTLGVCAQTVRVIDNKGTIKVIDPRWQLNSNGVDIYNTNTGNVGIGTNAPKATLHNNGSTILGSVSLGDYTTNPTLTAAATVDKYSGAVVKETSTAGISFVLPDPTDKTAGRIFQVSNSNISTQSITVGGVIIAPGSSTLFRWDGGAWNTLTVTNQSIIWTGSGDVTGTASGTSSLNPALTVTKINGSPLGTTTGATTGQVLGYNGTNWSPVSPSTYAWLLAGNGGTNPGTAAGQNYLGTTDTKDLVFGTHGKEKMRLFSYDSNEALGLGVTSIPGGISAWSGASLFLGNTGNIVSSTGLDVIIDADKTSTNSEFRIRANGDWDPDVIDLVKVVETGNVGIGIGNTSPTNRLHVKAASDPLRLEGLQTGATTDKLLSVDGTGVVRQQAISSIGSISLSTGTAGTTPSWSVSPVPLGGSTQLNIPMASANGTIAGLLSYADWTVFNGKQSTLNGTGYVKQSGTTTSYVSSIPNADLVNSTISGVSLGSNLNALTAGAGLQLNAGTTYDGSSSKTISLSSATSTTLGGVQLAGDLGGAAASPVVKGIQGKSIPTLSNGFLKYNSGTSTWGFDANTYLTSAYYQTVQSNGTGLTQRSTLNFGSEFTVADNTPNTRTDVSINNIGWSKITGAPSFLTLGSLSANAPLSYDNTMGKISISQATTSTDGYLSKTDWNTFNSKEPAITVGTTSQYWRGDKTWQTLNTSVVPEGTNLYFTNARGIGATLTGFTSGAGTITSSDNILQAIQKLNGNLAALNTGVSSVSGTANRITSTGGVNPVIDIASNYVGQTSITTLGTITSGTWNGAVIGSNYGGAGAVSGILKANGSGVVSAAVAGTDYVAPNPPITGATNTKITYDSKGLVTAGVSAVLASPDYVNQGTATTVLHGNVSGSPSWGPINLSTDVTGTLPITNGGTGATTAITALNNLLPSQTTNAGKVLTTDGTNASWAASTSSMGWLLGGNSISSGQFLGTNNDQALVINVNGQPAGLIGSINSGGSQTNLGYLASTGSQYSTAIGASSSASSTSAVAVGYTAKATNQYTIAIGGYAEANNTSASAVGYSAKALAQNATALGSTAQATKSSSTAVGYGAQATEANATAIGSNTTAPNPNTVILGNGANVGIGTTNPQTPTSTSNPNTPSSASTTTLAVNGIIDASIYTSKVQGTTASPLTGSSLTWDVSLGSSAVWQLSAGPNTLKLSNVKAGMYGVIIVKNAGNSTLTFDSGTNNKVINGGGGIPFLTQTSGAFDILSFFYDGTTYWWTIGNNYN